MSFYRSIFATLAAFVLASPVFSDDNLPQSAYDESAGAPFTQQLADKSNATTDETTQQTATTEDADTTANKLNLNAATVKDLIKVKGLNASKARAIVAYRKKHGDFKSLDDLNKVKGFKKIKPNTLKSIQEQLTI